MTPITKPAATALLALLSSPALGSPSLQVVSVDNTAALTGYITNDLQATAFDSDWTSAALLLELTGGSIYQEPEGFGLNGSTLGAPDPAGFGIFPSSQFDTYLDGNGQTVSFAGAAGDVGGDVLQFDTTQMDAAWYDMATADTGTFNIARITLADTATGTWSLLAVSEDGQRFDLIGTISQGVMAVDAQASSAATLAAYLNSAEYRRTIPRPTVDREPIDRTHLLSPVIPFPEIAEPLTVTGDADATLPEPGTVLLVGMGGLSLLRRRR